MTSRHCASSCHTATRCWPRPTSRSTRPPTWRWRWTTWPTPWPASASPTSPSRKTRWPESDFPFDSPQVAEDTFHHAERRFRCLVRRRPCAPQQRETVMQPWAILVCAAALLGGCASQTARQAPAQQLFHDQLFQPAAHPIDTASVFALSPAMRHYVQHDLGNPGPGRDVRRLLFDALYRRDKLQLEYDAAMTRTAAETFAARSGNCLSLAIMTAALARELKMPVVFQQVRIDEVWSRSGSLYFASNHVNLSLGRPQPGQNPYLATTMDVANSLT
ncbi:conserved hypothetical protein, partial [Ricinus communis]